MSNHRIAVIVIGLVILVIIIIAWTNELGQVEVGARLTNPFTGGVDWIRGDSPEAAAEKRAAINLRYGLWVLLVCAGVSVIAYMVDGKHKKKEPSEYDPEKNVLLQERQGDETKKEIAELKAKLKALEALNENEKDHNRPSEKEIIECPYCLEDIYAGAIKCKHCKTDLESKA